MTSYFQDGAMTSFQAEKCCHMVSAHAASARRICTSVRQFLIYITFVLSFSLHIIEYDYSRCVSCKFYAKTNQWNKILQTCRAAAPNMLFKEQELSLQNVLSLSPVHLCGTLYLQISNSRLTL